MVGGRRRFWGKLGVIGLVEADSGGFGYFFK